MAGKKTEKKPAKAKGDRMEYGAFKTKDGKPVPAAVKKVVNKKIDEFMEMSEEAQVLFSWFIVVDFLGVDCPNPEEVPAELTKKEFGGAMYG